MGEPLEAPIDKGALVAHPFPIRFLFLCAALCLRGSDQG